MNVTVIGGTGFIGQAVVATLSREHAVLAVGLPGRTVRGRPDGRHRTVHTDVLGDAAALAEAMRGADAVVYALAPRATGPQLGPAVVSAAARVAAAAVEAGVRRWLHLSNVSVYPSGTRWVDEDTPPDPGYPLGLATVRMESVTGDILCAGQVRPTFLRLGPVFATPALEGVLQSYVGSGDNWLSYVDRDDAAEAVRLALNEQPRRAYVVGDGEPLRAAVAAAVAAAHRGHRTHRLTDARARRLGPDSYGILTSSVRLRPRALIAAGWRPKPLRERALHNRAPDAPRTERRAPGSGCESTGHPRPAPW